MDIRLTETELSERWKKSVRTIQSWRRTGLGPQFLDLGSNTIRYRLEDVLAYEDSRAKGGEVPVRAKRAITRATTTLTMIRDWKMAAGSRTVIDSVLGELRDLTPEGGA